MKRLFVAALLLLWGLAAWAIERSGTIVYIDGAKYYIHTVQAGETLYSLARAYEVGEQAIRENNPAVAAGGLRAGETIKIPYVSAAGGEPSEKRLRRAFDLHFVSRGETLYSISKIYGIPIPTIIADNPALDPIHLRLGERILIRRQEIGTEDEAGSLRQWEEYRSSLNSVAEPGAVYHLVAPGETLYSLSRRFGTSEEELARLNGGLRASDLKAGAIVRVPGVAMPSEEGLLVAVPADSTARPDAAAAGSDPFADRVIEEVDFRALRRSERLDVALLLPIAQEGLAANTNYLEFYQGFLLGLDSVRTRYGCSVDVTLFNTGRDSAKIAQIVESEPFRRARLIVGPVYEEELAPVVLHAEQAHVPVVSPLAHLDRTNSDVLFQLAPDPACKYEKASNMFGAEKRITLIYGETTDSLFEREVLSLVGEREYRRHDYRYEHPNEIARRKEQEGFTSAADLTPLLDNDDDNLFIVMADNEIDVERILAALASADTSLSAARGHAKPRFAVLGNARWNRYANLDRTMFFKDRVTFISTYHAKRDAGVVADFDSAYIRAFGMLPTLYSYRGYDTAQIFAPAMYNDIEYDLESRRYTPLQTSYRFGSSEGRRTHVNSNWTRVNYHPDFTITIE